MAEQEERSGMRAGAGSIAHFLGNVLLGVSLGLLSYYAITNVMTLYLQAGLEAELEGPITDPEPRTVEAPDPWAGWEQEDLDYWQNLPLGGAFGRLVIPEMDADLVVVKGTEREHLQKGPGWIVQTDRPGQTGNAGISGHRTTYGAPFRRLDELGPGDRVLFYSPYRLYVYDVTEQKIVTPDRTEVVASTEDPRLTLTACHPPYSARFRLAVQAELVEVRLLEEEDS